MGAVRIQTDRLWLRPFAPADTDVLQELFGLPGIRRYLLDDQVMPRAWVEEEIASSEASFQRAGWGLWCIASESDGAAIGFTGYREFREPPRAELIWGLDPALWGRGLAREAAQAAARYGFEALGWDPIHVSLDAPNEASLGLALRLGCREVRRVPGPAHEQILMELSRADRSPGEGRYDVEPL